MATGLVLVQILGTVKERGIWDVPNWVPILTIFVFLSASTLGVAYGALSASWVSDREGSALGFEEAQRNWAEMWREEDDQNKSSFYCVIRDSFKNSQAIFNVASVEEYKKLIKN
nr:uncharacterized protein PAM68-like [Ipomoea trifida]